MPPIEFQDQDLPVQKTEGLEKAIKEEKDLVYNSEKLPIAQRRGTVGLYERSIHFLLT